LVDAASWAAVKLVQTQLADAVVLVGGAEKTQHAGLTAAIAKKPLACIGSFGAFQRAWIEGAPKLMIIHGRSPDRSSLTEYLSTRAGKVIVLAEQFFPGEPIPIKLERFASSVDGAIALVTPDDFGGLATKPRRIAARARENVWVEVGWFWGHRGLSNVLLLTKGDVTIPSDLLNVETSSYMKSPTEAASKIDQFIAKLRTASDTARPYAKSKLNAPRRTRGIK